LCYGMEVDGEGDELPVAESWTETPFGEGVAMGVLLEGGCLGTLDAARSARADLL